MPRRANRASRGRQRRAPARTDVCAVREYGPPWGPRPQRSLGLACQWSRGRGSRSAESAAFPDTGNTLVCEECFSMNSSTCSGDMKTCDDHVTHCNQTVGKFQIDGQNTVFQVYKSCSEKPCEEYYFSKSTSGGWDQLMSMCCKDDCCNHNPLTLPDRVNITNGIECPACFKINTYDCPETTMMNCTGDEIYCIDFKAIVDLTGSNPFKTRVLGCTNTERCNPPPPFPKKLVVDGPVMTCTKAAEP